MERGKFRVLQTPFSHPTITSGQHTNGPMNVWVEADGEWIDTNCHSLYKVILEIRKHGVERIRLNPDWQFLE